MPGIVGLITKEPRETAEPRLLRMVEALRHESFYETGAWIDEALGVYVGWVVRKNSFSSGIPARNESGDVVLVFSGEESPAPETIARLRKLGHDTEPENPSYLVQLYEADPAFPRGLNGRFHGLLVDRTRRTATLFNDRYGMHRLYYHESREAFYFAAEAKAILAERPELRRADLRSLGEFVACGCVLQDRTLFEDIRSLPGGSAWVFRNGFLERRNTYFQPREWEEQAPLDPESYYRELKDVFSNILPRYFGGSQPMGMSLTGGLDTRAVMAWQNCPPDSLPCYTYRGMVRESRDVRLAREVAAACRQPFHEITVEDDFLSRFHNYAERCVYLTEASVDLLRSPDLYLSQKVREIAPVRITGLYGDEILRGHRAFKPMKPTAGLFRPELYSYVRQAETTYAEMLREHPLTFTAFRQTPWFHHGILALE
jgi:asparagine synthase (glutamine-hydrolysing)